MSDHVMMRRALIFSLLINVAVLAIQMKVVNETREFKQTYDARLTNIETSIDHLRASYELQQRVNSLPVCNAKRGN